MKLQDLGWSSVFSKPFEQWRQKNLTPARVAGEHKHSYIIYSEQGEHKAEIAGKLRFAAHTRADFPTVGDWVAADIHSKNDFAVIRAVIPRRSCFSRKVPGVKTEEHVVAANIDIAFLVSGLDGDFNLRRIERYLTTCWDSGATPIILLNKSDLCSDIDDRILAAESVAPGVAVHPVSAKEHKGIPVLKKYLTTGKTAAFLGSSGAGKSSLINCLLGEDRLKVEAVREDDSRGRHTTTHRELIMLPSGMVIDTPGLRELQLWTDEGGLQQSFEDIEELALSCRFSDCTHLTEPGCAVRRALEDGHIDQARLDSFAKLKKELDYLTRRQDQKAQLVEKDKWKRIAQWSRKMRKEGWLKDK